MQRAGDRVQNNLDQSQSSLEKAGADLQAAAGRAVDSVKELFDQ
jgi:hypothetical protein